MINGKDLLNAFFDEECRFFTGVPDSVLGGFCAECERMESPFLHASAANEGNAVALGIGWWFAMGEPAVVYMQNSGLANALNPLVSLAHAGVYSIPMILLVGWRGMPGVRDEPQHRVKGDMTLGLSKLCGFESFRLDDARGLEKTIALAVSRTKQTNAPVIVLAPPGSIAPANITATTHAHTWTRTDAISVLLARFEDDDLIVATTGHIGRDLFGQFESTGRPTAQIFLSVGGMGHASQVAAGIALARPERRVWCLDGDGAFLMHLGGAAFIGARRLPNLTHVAFNNGVHASVGGMTTCSPALALAEVASVLGYQRCLSVSGAAELNSIRWDRLFFESTFVEIRVPSFESAALRRPPEPLKALGQAFREFCDRTVVVR